MRAPVCLPDDVRATRTKVVTCFHGGVNGSGVGWGGGADTRTLTTHLLESEIPHDEGKILSEALRDDL